MDTVRGQSRIRRQLIQIGNNSRALLSAAAMLGAMGASGGTKELPPPTPNYLSKLEHKVAWKAFPLTVHFKRNAHHTPEREHQAIAGFRQWESASDKLIRFEITHRPDSAEICVQFDPDSSDGSTTNSFSRGELVRADMKIGIRRGGQTDIECIAAHEFGHAVGITGHSDDRKDLMYPYRWMGKGCGISKRDINTLAARYPALAHRLQNPDPFTAEEKD